MTKDLKDAFESILNILEEFETKINKLEERLASMEQSSYPKANLSTKRRRYP